MSVCLLFYTVTYFSPQQVIRPGAASHASNRLTNKCILEIRAKDIKESEKKIKQ